MSLKPILIAAAGRSGTTALMAALGSDPHVAFERVYPYEHRYLTYLTKFAGLAGGVKGGAFLDNESLADHNDARVGRFPWPSKMPLVPGDWLADLWATYAKVIRASQPAATHYVEKVPDWVPAAARAGLACQTLYLTRDPRDVFRSASAFNRVRGWAGFGGAPGAGPMTFARNLAHGLLMYFENQRDDRDRPDCRSIRYESLIQDSPATIAGLNGFLGLHARTDAIDEDGLAFHRTSAGAKDSIGRWRREGLPDGVLPFLDNQLHESMTCNGYELSADATPPPVVALDWVDASNDGAATKRADGSVGIHLSGQDFFLELAPRTIAAESVRELWLCLRGETGEHSAVYWRRRDEGFTEERAVRMPFRPGPHWQIARFAVGDHEHWTGEVAQLRIDVFNDRTEPGCTGELRWLRPVW